LVIVDISPFVSETGRDSAYSVHSEILSAILSVNLRVISSRSDAESALKKLITSEKIRGFLLKNLQRTGENAFAWKLNAEALMKNLDKITSGVQRNPAFQQITGFPVIFLKGGESDHLPVEDYKDILKVFPVAEIIEIAGAGHWIHADNPEEVVKNIRRLLE
jgi:pimeloyl-ACP methyl ester carboxylesterase